MLTPFSRFLSYALQELDTLLRSLLSLMWKHVTSAVALRDLLLSLANPEDVKKLSSKPQLLSLNNVDVGQSLHSITLLCPLVRCFVLLFQLSFSRFSLTLYFFLSSPLVPFSSQVGSPAVLPLRDPKIHQLSLHRPSPI
jgi:hypothetical protein